jgi:AsmA-like C-terminal region
VNFTHVNLGTLAETSTALEDKLSGIVSGEASFKAKGTGRDELIQSLQCRGEGEARKVEIRGLDLDGLLHGAIRYASKSSFGRVEAAFTCAAEGVHFSKLYLGGSGAEYGVSGSIDFARNVDWLVRVLPTAYGTEGGVADPPDEEFRLTGPLFSPVITPIEKASVRR